MNHGKAAATTASYSNKLRERGITWSRSRTPFSPTGISHARIIPVAVSRSTSLGLPWAAVTAVDESKVPQPLAAAKSGPRLSRGKTNRAVAEPYS